MGVRKLAAERAGERKADERAEDAGEPRDLECRYAREQRLLGDDATGVEEGGGETEQALGAADEFFGSGAAVTKSAALSSVSVQESARARAFVALPPGAAPLPS